MTLHLVDSWYNLGCLKKTLSLCDGEIRDTNGTGKAFCHQFLHSLSHRDTAKYQHMDVKLKVVEKHEQVSQKF